MPSYYKCFTRQKEAGQISSSGELISRSQLFSRRPDMIGADTVGTGIYGALLSSACHSLSYYPSK